MGKVIDIFEAKRKKEAKDPEKQDSADGLFADIIKKNSSNEERQKRDRIKANKSVLKSYRIRTKT